MARFDVYANPDASERKVVPYLLDVQSDLIDQLSTRLVMPLSRVGASQPRLPPSLCLVVEIKAESLTLLAYLAAPVAARLLTKPVGSLRYRASEISAALDAVISGF